jgi:uncharacterized repeat protein (TIGR03806 family)
MKFFRSILLVLSLVSMPIAAIDKQAHIKGKFFPKLSDYRFFKDLTNQIPADEVLPYELQSDLFSDYTHKQRFVYVPPAMKVGHEKNKVFMFPVGSVLIKTFSYQNTMSELTPQLLETRLLIHSEGGWKAVSYIWNEDQSEAYLSLVGRTIQTSFSDEGGNIRSVRYRAPNKNQCKECHQINASLTPIGPKARNMDLTLSYDDKPQNQLAKWHDLGWIDQDIDFMNMINYSSLNEDIEDRARAYLEINCAHCHIPGGAADTTGLYLMLEETNKKSLGFYKKPVAAGKASFNLKYSIVPKKPNQSILLRRMESMDPGIMMPESGRALKHVEGIEVISEWINSL